MQMATLKIHTPIIVKRLLKRPNLMYVTGWWTALLDKLTAVFKIIINYKINPGGQNSEWILILTTKTRNDITVFNVYTSDVYTFDVYTFDVYTFSVYTFSVFTFSVYTFSVYTFNVYTFNVYTFTIYTFII